MINNITDLKNGDTTRRNKICGCIIELFEKYIIVNADYEVNISFEVRSLLTTILDNDIDNENYSNMANKFSDIELYCMYDDAIKEVCALLKSRFVTFKKTQESNQSITKWPIIKRKPLPSRQISISSCR